MRFKGQENGFRTSGLLVLVGNEESQEAMDLLSRVDYLELRVWSVVRNDEVQRMTVG